VRVVYEEEYEPARPSYSDLSRTAGVEGHPNVNARYVADIPLPQALAYMNNASRPVSEEHWDEAWEKDQIMDAAKENVVMTWGPTAPVADLALMVRGEGVYLFDSEGNKYLDWTSQAVCANLGYSVPPAVTQAMAQQLNTLPYIYGGMGMVEIRARMASLMAELAPGDLNNWLFPQGGGEANEAAIRMARRYTGKHKILTMHRSYHGGSATTLNATGDFRRWFSDGEVSGIVKMYNPQPIGFSWGESNEEACERCLLAMEDAILSEGPQSIAAVMLESIVGANGVLVPPVGYMEGVRALCDQYGILLICDEVMTGFWRTGEMFAFQHFNMLPDIVTCAKGLSAGYFPVSAVGCRDHIRAHFETQPLGWGATYQAHPVGLAVAYEVLKHSVANDLESHVKDLQGVFLEGMNSLVENHKTVKRARGVGLFGCLDLVGKDGKAIQRLDQGSPEAVRVFRKTLRDHGLVSLFRPPFLHCAPPLVITEEELRDGFSRLDRALTELDRMVEA